ncbi:MAG: hypothetical protein GXZ04_06435 [Clostridiales bacterium]|nr:hypothetical protein [Clostridiales bacterium]
MKKNKTLKWLVVFVAVLLASMFFSRTVQTITTPKIQKIAATRGKLEEKIPVTAELTFSQGEEIYVKNAKKLNLIFADVLASQGYFVKKGDVLAKAEIPSFQEEMDKIQNEHEKAVRELGNQIVSRVRLPKDSEHNQLHEHYLASLQKYYDMRLKAQDQASAIGYELPEDIEAWGRPVQPEVTPKPQTWRATPTPVPLADMPGELKGVMQEAFDAWWESDQIYSELRKVFAGTSKVPRTADITFEYIQKIYEAKRAVSKHSEAMVALKQEAEGLDEIVAPHDGYLIKFEIKKGETYDGSKPLYVISKEGEIPALKADITEVKKTIEKGTKVELENVRQELAVSEVKLEALNKKSVIVELSDAIITQLGGISAMMSSPPQITLVYKSSRTTTLLPASAVRTDADGSNFIFSVEQSWGGLLGNSQFVLKKVPITVLEKSSRYVSISEEVSYYQIADKEDRAVRDGQVVMEYVD